MPEYLQQIGAVDLKYVCFSVVGDVGSAAMFAKPNC